MWGLPGNRNHPSSMSLTSKSLRLLELPQVPKTKFNQRSEKIKKNSQTRQNNRNGLVMKQGQGPSVPPRGL